MCVIVYIYIIIFRYLPYGIYIYINIGTYAIIYPLAQWNCTPTGHDIQHQAASDEPGCVGRVR